MLTSESLDKIDSLTHQLSSEKDQWMSLAIAIDLSDEIMKVILPNNPEWRDQLNRNSRQTGELPPALPRDIFHNQKEIAWFHEHPKLASARSAFSHFQAEDAAIESKFYWFSESATKLKISVATEYSPNWEDSELTRKPEYKVGIDFFLSGDNNSLLMVTSNQQKLRVLEFSGRLSNTQKQILKNNLDGAAAYTGIKNGIKEEFEPQRTIHTTVWNALQLKEVNNKFYNIIAAHFQELVTSLSNQGFKLEDSKQFSSRLLGRLLFIWFLRKMDVINEDVGYFNVAGKTASEYYDHDLKTLFFKTLNTEIELRQHDDVITPYLNGGLFDAKSNDFFHEYIEFPDGFFERLYDHFNEFNFTTDESSFDFELIAVDPEMLGQVFESLLASQLDEDGGNERSKTGAFYTPRAIVGYMVKETLRNYLYSKMPDNFKGYVDELLDLSDSKWSAKGSTSTTEIFGVNTKKFTVEVKKALDTFKVLDLAVGSGAFPMGMLQLLLKTYQRIEKKSDPYQLKLSIIENSIFGVDIQPMAIEIARLRAWLSVIVDEQDKKNIQPLPNLEFKFLSANSLVSLEKGQTDVFANPRLDEELAIFRDKYFNARSSATKRKAKEEYDLLTRVDLFDDQRSKQLKTFFPFENRESAEFFDSKYMFGVDGFDAVIGNPPYIHFEKMDKPLRDFYKENAKKLDFSTYAARGDIYTLFYEKGMQVLNDGGFLAFITSNKWMRSKYGEKLRDFFVTQTNPINLIDLGSGVFESATVDTNILLTQKAENKHQLKAVTLTEDSSENMSDYIQQQAVIINYHAGESWTILNEIEQSIKKKIEAVGTPLKDWDIKINRGILTGLNEAFIISKEKRDELIAEDPKSAEIIRPILRGRDIKKNAVDFQNIYLINSHNGYVDEQGKKIPPIDIELYPAVKNWLDNGRWNKKTNLGSNFDRLAKRTDKGVTPYNLRSLAYMDDFNHHKILWSDIATEPSFALSTEEIYINNTAYMIQGAPDKLVRLLNSTIIKWYFPKIASDLGKGIRFFKQFVEEIPLPLPQSAPTIYHDYPDEKLFQDALLQYYNFTNDEVIVLYGDTY